MSKPITVGITGGIGSGKTLVCKLFSLLGVPIYNADNRAKELMNTALREPIKTLLGSNSFIDGKLNRAFIAQQVFSNKTKLDKLNSIVHPAVANDFENWVAKYTKAKYVIKEAALLVESGSHKQLDKLIVISAPELLRIERIKARDFFRTEEEIKAIIVNQLPEDEKLNVADFIIYNNEKQLLIPQVLEIDKKIKRDL